MIRLLYLLFIIAGFTACPGNDKQEPSFTQWEKVGPGGGGAMFNPAVSPHNADYAYVACDMTGSYVTYNGGLSWRMFSLRATSQILCIRSHGFKHCICEFHCPF